MKITKETIDLIIALLLLGLALAVAFSPLARIRIRRKGARREMLEQLAEEEERKRRGGI